MGLEDVSRRFRGRNQPKVGRTLDPTLLMKVLRLFQQYGNIHVVHFPALFQSCYDEIFDAAAMGFDDGLMGFFRETNIVDLTDIYENPLATLKAEHRARSEPEEKTEEQKKKDCLKFILNRIRGRNPLFNLNNLELWGDFAHLLSQQNHLVIPPSPFETSFIFNSSRFENQVHKIQLALREYPNGIKLNEINNIVRINKRLLHAPSISDAVLEYPELFFWTEPDEFEGEPIIFDGLTTTHEDLSGSTIQGSVANCIVYRLIVSGLYQKTLLLMRKVPEKGLKLTVWYSAVGQNFKKDAVQPYEHDLLNIGRDLLFLSLASQNLVIIRSGDVFKNDLRLFLPTEPIDFKNLLGMLKVDHERFPDPIPKDQLDGISKILYQKINYSCFKMDSITNSLSDSSCSSDKSS